MSLAGSELKCWAGRQNIFIRRRGRGKEDDERKEEKERKKLNFGGP